MSAAIQIFTNYSKVNTDSKVGEEISSLELLKNNHIATQNLNKNVDMLSPPYVVQPADDIVTTDWNAASQCFWSPLLSLSFYTYCVVHYGQTKLWYFLWGVG